MNSPIRDFPLARGRLDTEPYTPVIVEDLISGLNDWRSVQDIVRLTFKALSDVVKSQGSTLKEIELQLPSKASKADITQCMALKSSYSEAVRSLAEVRNALENKAGIDDIYSIAEEKVSKNDLQYLIDNKVNYEDLRNMLSEKADIRELQGEIRALRNSIEEINEEVHRKMQLYASNRDLQQLQSVVETKANSVDVFEVLEEKANKQSVANALHRKANKADVEGALENKVDINDYNRLIESLEIINKEIQLKVEKHDIVNYVSSENVNKIERNEFDTVVDSIQALRKESENKVFSHLSNLEGYVSSIKSELEDFQSSIKSELEEFQLSFSSSLTKKSECKDIDKIYSILSNKIEVDELNSFSKTFQLDISEMNQSIRYDFHKYQEFCNERSLKSEQCCKCIQDEISRIHENIRVVCDKIRENNEETVNSMQSYISGKFDDVKMIRMQIEQSQKGLEELQLKKIDRSDFRKIIDGKIEIRDMQEMLERQNRDTIRQIQHASDELKDLILKKERELILIIDGKPGVHEITSLILEHNISKLKKSYNEESMNEERSLRASTTIEYQSRDTFNSIENIQREFTNLRAEVDSRFLANINEQNHINEMLCAENCIARWLWRSGDLSTGFSIPWEIESVNTCPENFIWEAHCTSIITSTPGLYEINYAVFSRKRPSIEVLVNGEPILLEFSSTGKAWGRHNDGNIIGASAIEFLALPQRARISMTYSGESGAEGFLALKKL